MAGIEDDSVIAEQLEVDDKNSTNGDSTETPSNNDNGTNGKGDGLKSGEKNAFEEVKADTEDVKNAAHAEQEAKTASISSNNGGVVEDSTREAAIPSSILEKGVIYFFYRARVGVTELQGIEDVARSYLVLRPLP